MVTAIVGLGTTYLLTIIATVVWGVRQEGRINGHDTLFVEREKQQSARDDEIIRRLERIERKQDAAANGRREDR